MTKAIRSESAGGAARQAGKVDKHVNKEQVARRLLDSISESTNFDPDNLARVAGQFITRNGNQVYPVRINGRTVFVTIPED